mmetsp:Transcript_4345/g.6518  ORF Transcript_4345/g.6518 Transcript_4345/m.6518 type:complete len:278 (+) Transcript_4345:16-849(+)
MGNVAGQYPKDYRVDRCVATFRLTDSMLKKFWSIFCAIDLQGSGYITVEDYLKLIDIPRSSLTDAMFNLLDSKDDGNILFGEFVEITTTFSCFEPMDLLKYFFFILDPHRTGLVEKNDVKHFVTTIWNAPLTSNIKEAFSYLDSLDDGDGCFTFKEVMDVHSRFPNTFYPLFRLQVHIMRATLGDTWWDFHKAKLYDTIQEEKAQERARLINKIKQESAAINEENDDMVMKRMGVVKFYLMPWKRQAERDKLKKIAAIEDELDNNPSTKATTAHDED